MTSSFKWPGQGNVGARGVDGKLYGYRAQASAGHLRCSRSI